MKFKNPIYLSVDEWGAFGRNFMNVLPIAQCLNSFIRHADVVKMANFTTLLRCFQPTLKTELLNHLYFTLSKHFPTIAWAIRWIPMFPAIHLVPHNIKAFLS